MTGSGYVQVVIEKNMEITNKDRILDISKRNKLAHIGSCLSVLPILEEIYANKRLQDYVIMDNAHAHLAHLVVMSGHPEEMIKKYGIHCDKRAGCDASGGSLGHGIGISIGYALANPKRQVHCIVSDGSMMEGSNWEALRIINDLKVTNIRIYCNFNSFTAVGTRDPDELFQQMYLFTNHIRLYKTENGEGFEGIQGHYKIQ